MVHQREKASLGYGIEKILKAIFLKQTQEIPPKIHNLNKLAEFTHVSNELSEDKKTFFEELLIYYFSSRYPDKSAIIKKELTEDLAINTFNKTKEILEWLKNKL